jgi:hypothetical protein
VQLTRRVATRDRLGIWPRLLLAATAVLTLLCPGHGLADEASGTWTGAVELRGNYFWETSTRVLAPEIITNLDSPKGNRVGVDYLVDAITSASVAAGALEDNAFTEVRHDVTVKAGHDFDDGKQPWQLDGGARISREPDYTSAGGFVQPTLWLADRASKLVARFTYLHNEVRQVFRGQAPSRPDGVGGIDDSQFKERFNAYDFALGWEQILLPNLILELAYGFLLQRGYLANPYRTVMGGQRPEEVPDVRRRQLLYSRLAWYLPRTSSSLQLIYRAYVDSWQLGTVNPEFRIYQEMGPSSQLRLRYRYYAQTAAFFWKPEDEYTFEDPYVTDDPKLSPFHINELGVQLLVIAGFLTGKIDWLARASFDLSFNYRWNTNDFGNQVIAQAAVKVPF